MENKILSPLNDAVFQMLMGAENSTDILTDFLLAVLKLPYDEYDDMTISNPFLMREYKGDKLGILDVKLKLKSGKTIHVEVQVDPVPAMKSRILFYMSKLITEQINESEHYESIKRVVTIVITDYPLIKESVNYHHHFGLFDIESKVLFTDILEIHTLEIPKARKVSGDTKNSSLFDWMKFFDIKTEEELNMVAARSPVMKKATMRLAELSADEKARQIFEAREKERRDNLARQRGAVKSREIEIATNALQLGMSIADIANLTGLTISEIESLRNAG